MGALSIWHILIIAVVLVLLFGRGKISDIMGDTAKGIRQFRKGLAEPDEPARTLPGERPADTTNANKDTAAHS
jgi:sec-independent protein translocase protein TatA